MAATTAQGLTPVEVGQKYFELQHQLRRTVDQALFSCGISFTRMKVLMRLHEHGEMNQSRLANLLGFAPRSVTETVDTLEREGLVTRAQDPKDRRVRIVALTPAGQDAYTTSRDAREAVMTTIFGSLDAAERDTLAALLDKIRHNLPTGESK